MLREKVLRVLLWQKWSFLLIERDERGKGTSFWKCVEGSREEGFGGFGGVKNRVHGISKPFKSQAFLLGRKRTVES